MDNEIINKYRHGKNIRTLSAEYNMSPEAIREILDKEGITLMAESGNMRIFSKAELEKAIDMNNHFYSYNEIGKELKCSYTILRNIFKRNGIIKTAHNFKNHNIIYDYFSNIDCEEKAYFIGLLFTDGSIRNNNIRLQLKRSDGYMVQKLRDAVHSNVDLQEDNRVGKEMIGVEINMPQGVKDLEKYGIVMRKTYLLDNIHIDLFPKELQRHYIRGLIDGDGAIFMENASQGTSIQPIINFSSYSEECVRSFQYFLDTEVFKTDKHNKILKANSYQCKWKGAQKLKPLFHYLYDDATIYLERKYEIAKQFM